MNRFGQGLGAAVVILGAVLVYNTLNVKSRQIEVAAVEPIAIDESAAAERLAQVIRFRTVSHLDSANFAADQFTGLHDHLEQTYPALHTALEKETVSDYSLLYRWPGSDPELQPVLLMAHMDVVPIEPGTEDQWEHPPFAGAVADGYIWGRGAMDDKGSFTAIFEAVNRLAAEGYTPQRTLYLAFGHDEEIGGANGAVKIAALLAERGIRLALVMDEGSAVITGAVPGVEGPAAQITIAEKGYLTLVLTASAQGGHSARPPEVTSIGALARVIAALRANQMPARLTRPAEAMLDYLAPRMDFWSRLAIANKWLFAPLIVSNMEKSPATNAMVRTTTSPTILKAGIKDNVLPSSATAMVNFRILPGDTIEDVVAHVERIVGDEPVEVTIYPESVNNPSPVADPNSPYFKAIARTVRQTIPDAMVIPGLTLGATDSRHFNGIADNGFRFNPLRMTRQDFSRVHGLNERVAVDNFAEMIRFYVQFVRNQTG